MQLGRSLKMFVFNLVFVKPPLNQFIRVYGALLLNRNIKMEQYLCHTALLVSLLGHYLNVQNNLWIKRL